MREIILYIVSRFPRGIGRTRLMKLAFVIDAVSKERLGRRLLGGKWVRWYFGPFNKAVLDVLDDLFEDAVVDIIPSSASVRYISLEEPPELPPEVLEIVEEVIENYGFKHLDDLLDEIYRKWEIDSIPLGEVIL